VDGCGKTVKARGWCNTHWRRWRRHGDPTIVILSGWKQRRPPKPPEPGRYSWTVGYTRVRFERVTYTVSCGDCGAQIGTWQKPRRGDWMADRMLGAWWARQPAHTCEKERTA
jgi:hypothetical protein